jgi:hypothetical protein
MSYHDLSECTLNADERREEANRILANFEDAPGKDDPDSDDFTEVEREFIERMKKGGPVSVKQLFWLRDMNQ